MDAFPTSTTYCDCDLWPPKSNKVISRGLWVICCMFHWDCSSPSWDCTFDSSWLYIWCSSGLQCPRTTQGWLCMCHRSITNVRYSSTFSALSFINMPLTQSCVCRQQHLEVWPRPGPDTDSTSWPGGFQAGSDMAAHRRTCRTTAFRPPVSTLGSTCVPPTVNYLQ